MMRRFTLTLLAVLALAGSAASADAASPGAIFSASQSTPTPISDSNKAGLVDPIVTPGPVGTLSEHPHVFCGAEGMSSASTFDSMLASATTFVETGIHSGGWMPEVTYDGVPLKMGTTATGGGKHCLFYYRRKGAPAGVKVQPFPHGFSMILRAGTTLAGRTVMLGDGNFVAYKCGPGSAPYSATPPSACSSGVLSVDFTFPNCWDGVLVDGDEIAAGHVVYPGSSCPASHPIVLPRLQQFFRFWMGTGAHDPAKFALGGHGTETAHSDYKAGWRDDTQADFLARCINANVDCGKNPALEG